MSASFEVTSNTDAIEADVKQMNSVTKKAMASALNRAGQSARTAATKSVRTKYSVKAKAVNETFKMDRATAGNLNITLKSHSGTIPLIRFNVSPSKPSGKRPKVLKASVKLAGGKKPIPGAFVTSFAGKTGVFEREGAKRHPIVELYGPPIPVMLNSDAVQADIEDAFEKVFNDRFPHEMDRLLGRL